MWWKNIIGQKKIINQLKKSIYQNRIPHAQIFLGETGFGTLALSIAYASEILYQENIKNIEKIKKLIHGDLHFFFPTIQNENYLISRNLFLSDWIKFIYKNFYISIDEWYNFIKINNQQGVINTKDVDLIFNTIKLKSIEGGSKIIIIWMIDKINLVSANKFLKILEEPPINTYFILIAENKYKIISTILSRCQIINIPPIKNEDIINNLYEKYKYSKREIYDFIRKSNGNWNIILQLIHKINRNEEFEKYLIIWVRLAFQIKKQPKFLIELNNLSLILSNFGREKQKKFLNYSLEFFRQAWINNYSIDSLIYLNINQNQFNWSVFSKYINQKNIVLILKEISKANFYIERNANSKIVFLNLLIVLSKFLHKSM